MKKHRLSAAAWVVLAHCSLPKMAVLSSFNRATVSTLSRLVAWDHVAARLPQKLSSRLGPVGVPQQHLRMLPQWPVEHGSSLSRLASRSISGHDGSKSFKRVGGS